jgi:hypothetical protein
MDKVAENRVRRSAARQGLRLEKCRARDPHAIGYATYRLVDARTGRVKAHSGGYGNGLTLEEVRQYLTRTQTVRNITGEGHS